MPRWEPNARKHKAGFLYHSTEFAYMLFFAGEQDQEEDDCLRIKQAALDPAELAWRKMGIFGIEQTPCDTARGNNE